MSQHTHQSAYVCEGSLAVSSNRPHFRVIEGGRQATQGRMAKPCQPEESRQGAPYGLAPELLRRRQLSAILAAVLVMVVIGGAWLFSDLRASSRMDEALAQAAQTTITVMPGDTLWGIAEAHPIQGCTTSQLVDYIASANCLPSGPLSVGISLTIPTSAA